MTALEVRWHCLGPATVPPQLCPETGDTDASAQAHTTKSGHTTLTSMRPEEAK